ncbi:MAG: 1-acyl-sn-glycerol-3-phosphate acyltransferase [Rhizobiales bacterium]|nr:1-acyl-sn-glycerol-3-phosphate acyltransferase [Hyphomicrobiales bacterium]
MLFLRSLVFQIVFYLNFIAFALAMPVMLLMPRAYAWHWAVYWMRSVLFWLRIIVGTTCEFRGLENVPEKGCILASKHQSAWETIAFGTVLDHLAFVMKQELMAIPVFGWFAQKTGMIPIRRAERSRALGSMVEAAVVAVSKGSQIVIFMEGTRMAAGTARPYKAGVVRMAQKLGCPIVPIALNSGLFWPRNKFMRYPGRVLVEFLPPMTLEDDIRKTLNELEMAVEAASNALILETARSDNPPPTIASALAALKARGVDITIAR